MLTARTLVFGAVLLLPTASFADICEDIVADTIAEVRAGAGGGWSADIQNLVRAAAGSACIKTQSGRYVGSQRESLESGAANIPADAPTPGPVSMETAPLAAEQPLEIAEQVPETSEALEKEDDGSWSMGGLTFRSMSGSPTQKPYERARKNKKADQ